MRAAYKLGYDLGQGDDQNKEKYDDYQLAGKILGVTFAFVSIAVSVSFVTFKLPTTFNVSYDLTLKTLDYLPDQLAMVVSVAMDALTSTFAPAVSILSDAGFSAILGTVVVTSGLLAASSLRQHLVDGVKSWLAPAKKEIAAMPSSEPKGPSSMTTVLQTLRLVSECIAPIVTSNIIPKKSADIVPLTLGKQHLFKQQPIESQVKSAPELITKSPMSQRRGA